MIKILFITSDFAKPQNGSNIYTDLAEALKEKGHDINVVVTEEKKKINKTTLDKERNILVLRSRIGNLYEVGLFEKGITFLTLGRKVKKDIKKYFGKDEFDLILFQSPPLTMFSIVKWAMKKFNAKSYLMMKDIFPQNGVDIGMYSQKSLIYKYFRKKEKKLYMTASKIGCMSEGNIEYLLKHNDYLEKDKLELFPNTVNVDKIKQISEEEKQKIRKKYRIRSDDIAIIYGGNFGKPQGLDFLVDIVREYKDNRNLKFILIGKGTEKEKIFSLVKSCKNVYTYDFMPRDDYEKISSSCDIGLISLDKRFTIPNFPSKTLSYFASAIPIMACIDKNTDYSKLIDDANCGYWVENGDLENFKIKFEELINNKKLREKMGKNGFKYLKKYYDVKKSVKILERFMSDKNE